MSRPIGGTCQCVSRTQRPDLSIVVGAQSLAVNRVRLGQEVVHDVPVLLLVGSADGTAGEELPCYGLGESLKRPERLSERGRSLDGNGFRDGAVPTQFDGRGTGAPSWPCSRMTTANELVALRGRLLRLLSPDGPPGLCRSKCRIYCGGPPCTGCGTPRSHMTPRAAPPLRCCWPDPATPVYGPWSGMPVPASMRSPSTSPSAVQPPVTVDDCSQSGLRDLSRGPWLTVPGVTSNR